MLPSPNAPPPRPDRRLAPWLIGAVVLVLLAAGLVAVFVRSAPESKPAQVGAGPTPTTTAAGGNGEASGETGSTTTTPASPPVPSALKRQFDELQAQTAAIRGLQWKGPLDLRVVTPAELSRMVREVVARDTDPKQVAGEEATLKLLGLIPDDLDYGDLVNDVLAGAVLGYYDPLTQQLVVGSESGDGELDAHTRWVIVHEMNHALTDQVFRYGAPTDALYKADKADEATAYSALLEGDAVLVQNEWAAQHLSDEEQLIIAFGLGGGSDLEAFLSAPEYVQQDLMFPYNTGSEFVQGLYDQGGFAAIDAAYRRPPTSTEQILHPETYRANQPSAPPALPDLAGATGCTRMRTGTLGQLDMRAALDLHLLSTDAERAVEGWNGDAYAVVRCGDSLGMGQRWETDAGANPARFVENFGRWAAQWSGSGRLPGTDGRFSGPSGAGRIVRDGSRIDIVLAEDQATADKLIAFL
jgi:hypothetical protein